MKVGMIGLGSMGESMSRRMIKASIEVWGYRNNYEKACEQYEAGYVSGVTTSLQSLVQAVKSDGKQYTSAGKIPGIFQLAVPKKSISGVMDELLKFCSEGDIIINYCNCDVKDTITWADYLSKLGMQYIDAGVVGGVSGLDHGYSLVVTGGKYAVDTCRTIFDAASHGIKPSHTKNDYLMYPQDYGWIYRNW